MTTTTDPAAVFAAAAETLAAGTALPWIAESYVVTAQVPDGRPNGEGIITCGGYVKAARDHVDGPADARKIVLSVISAQAALDLGRAVAAVLDKLRPVTDPNGTYPVYGPLSAALTAFVAALAGETE